MRNFLPAVYIIFYDIKVISASENVSENHNIYMYT